MDFINNLPTAAKIALLAVIAVIALVIIGAVIGFIVKVAIFAVIVAAIGGGGYLAAKRFGIV